MPSDPRPPEHSLESSFAEELRAVRPDLVPAFHRALPGARAAVLARLWRSLRFEQLPGAEGHRLDGPDLRGYEVGAPKDEFTVQADGRTFTDPAALVTALGLVGGAGFAAEVAHSTASLALSRAGAADASGKAGPAGTADAATPPRGTGLVGQEQSVVDGHPYHPCCRSRPGFTVADQLAYAPEHRPVVPLGLVPLPPSACAVVGDWPEALRDGRGRLLLPAHPWQLREVLPGLGFPAAEGSLTADPLMALRTLAPVDGGPHLKTALSLRMTSSVRDISGSSVRNSGALSALLTAVTERLGGALVITRNLAAASALTGPRCGSLTGPGREFSAELAVLVRESPEVHAGPGERVLPLGAISAVSGDPVAWLGGLARLAWPPLLRLLSWGVALEAHGQNLLVVLDQRDRPLRLVYRDLADVRISPLRLAGIGVHPGGLAGHVLEDDPARLRRKLTGSLLGGGFSSLVSQLGLGSRGLEDELWAAVADAARSAAAVLTPEDRRALLEQPLPVKALSRMRLEGQPPGDQWTLLPNPLAAAPGGKSSQ
ncbi:IucA/IucC family protein [Streptacidiphilus cavernicola]|uniref:IucA/IucC family protein n=1 Tax=Streptacidiphilus cavernicola TaxID=3342716 RepID=A0ABV6W1G8_9ACTN